MTSLSGKVAIVTGASAGIGAAIATEFAAAGAHLLLVARNKDKLTAKVASLPGNFASDTAVGSHTAHAADVCDPDAAPRVVAAAVQAFGRVDILVNNAGGNVAGLGPLFAVSDADALKAFTLNVLAPMAWARAAWEHSMAEHGGVVLNVSSLSGQHGSAGTGMYAISKAALDRMTAQLAWELAPRVRVLGIAPGMTETELTTRLIQRVREQLVAGIPLGRIGTTVDIARFARFLVSDEAGWISGVTLPLDGAETAVPLGAGLPFPVDPRPSQSF
jgi:NAD(P)-dependent dehydrogenase (short-subunit alcohol dehydrogenase family)